MSKAMLEDPIRPPVTTRNWVERSLIRHSGWIVAAVAIALAIAHISSPKIDRTFIGLSLLAVVPLLLPSLSQYVRSFEGFGLKLEMQDLRAEVKVAASKLDQLYLLSLGGKNVKHLKKLNQPGGYGRCYVGTALPRELEYLENLGYIEFNPPMRGLDDFLGRFKDRDVDNLSNHVRLTEAGRLFYQQREGSLQRRGGDAPEGARVPDETAEG